MNLNLSELSNGDLEDMKASIAAELLRRERAEAHRKEKKLIDLIVEIIDSGMQVEFTGCYGEVFIISRNDAWTVEVRQRKD